MEISTKITDLRGSKVRPIHRGSVLLSKQEDLCSTSYVTRVPGNRGHSGFPNSFTYK